MGKTMMIMLTVCLFLMITGCSGAKQTRTSAQVIQMFNQYGIELSEAKKLHPNNVFVRELNGVRPETYSINGSQLISIYVYENGRDAGKGVKEFERQTAAADVVAHDRYMLANILMFYVADATARDERVERAVESLR